MAVSRSGSFIFSAGVAPRAEACACAAPPESELESGKLLPSDSSAGPDRCREHALVRPCIAGDRMMAAPHMSVSWMRHRPNSWRGRATYSGGLTDGRIHTRCRMRVAAGEGARRRGGEASRRRRGRHTDCEGMRPTRPVWLAPPCNACRLLLQAIIHAPMRSLVSSQYVSTSHPSGPCKQGACPQGMACSDGFAAWRGGAAAASCPHREREQGVLACAGSRCTASTASMELHTESEWARTRLARRRSGERRRKVRGESLEAVGEGRGETG